jgi:hypothetical protein
MQAMPPGSVGHHAAGEFVDDLHLVGVDQILFVAEEAPAAR